MNKVGIWLVMLTLLSVLLRTRLPNYVGYKVIESENFPSLENTKMNLRRRGITPAYVSQVINAAAIVMLLRFLTN